MIRISRRAMIRFAGVSLLGLSGCTTSIGSRTPSPTWAGGVERLQVDHPGLAWAVQLPEQRGVLPTAEPERKGVFVGANDDVSRQPMETVANGEFGRVYALREENGRGTWKRTTTAPISGPFVVHDGRVHVQTGYPGLFGGREGRLVAFDVDGSRLWRTDAVGAELSIVAASGGTVYAGTSDDAGSSSGERLFAYGPDGTVTWDRDAGDAYDAAVSNGLLLYGAAGNEIVAYDLQQGDERWRVDEPPVGTFPVDVVAFDDRCFTRSWDGDRTHLVARSVTDGSVAWRYRPRSSPGNVFSPTAVADVAGVESGGTGDLSVVGTEFGNFVFALDGDGTERWTVRTAGSTRDRVLVDDAVYVADGTGTLYALDPADGSERWRSSDPPVFRIWLLSDGLLATCREQASADLVSFGPGGEERWRYSDDANLSRPTISGDRAYVGTSEGSVLAFDATA